MAVVVKVNRRSGVVKCSGRTQKAKHPQLWTKNPEGTTHSVKWVDGKVVRNTHSRVVNA